MATSSEDPWAGLAIPGAAEAISARRVDATNPWNFFWGRNQNGRYLLVLRHSIDARPIGRLPHLKEIEVREHVLSPVEPAALTFTLLDPAQKDIFYRLCTDIVERASQATEESEAIFVALARTWRWHYLLSGGRDGRLSIEEQQGLIGELLVLERLLLPRLPAHDAVSAWRGPLGSPKDFEIGSVCVEAKTHRRAATPRIAVNSEHQLDDSVVSALFLFVAELARTASSTDGGTSITEIARRVRQTVEQEDPAAVGKLDEMLEAAGFRWEDDYTDTLWLVGAGRLYRVAAGFPRLTAEVVPAGVTDVTYTISLTECAPFRVAEDELFHALEAQA